MTKTLALLLALSLVSVAKADEFTLGDLTIDYPWSKEVPPTSQVIAGFFDVANHGIKDDRLIRASSPIAGKIELHNHFHSDGMMRMRQVDFIDVPADDMVTLEPGGLHIMFFELEKVPLLGESFPVVLTFEKAGDITVNFSVEDALQSHDKRTTTDEAHDHHHHETGREKEHSAEHSH